MFNLELSWNRGNKLISQTTTHILRVRITPNTLINPKQGLPLRMAIAIDTSHSMQGEKLESAKEACRAIIEQLQ